MLNLIKTASVQKLPTQRKGIEVGEARETERARERRGDFPRWDARGAVSCRSLRRLEVINYANERLMMPPRPANRSAKSHPSSRGSHDRWTHFREDAIFPRNARISPP
jgi:hypothetical protein